MCRFTKKIVVQVFPSVTNCNARGKSKNPACYVMGKLYLLNISASNADMEFGRVSCPMKCKLVR